VTVDMATDRSKHLAATAAALGADRQSFVLATVVRAERPTSAKPGDAALVLADGTIVGFVGGECAEASVREQALAALRSTEPVLLKISPVPCPAEPGMISVHNPCLSGGTLEIFLEPSLPAPLLVIHGTAPIALALAGLAERLGWAVVAWAGDLAPDADAVVVASHGRDEHAVLAAAVRARVPYIGLVASRRRGAAVVAALDHTAGIHTPAGLDIGARNPDEVALSILAEIVSLRPRQRGERVAVAPPGAATAVDPVCGMAVAAVEASLNVEHAGRRWWFCGSGCRQAFVADPSAFA
jgi:xanthine dehydrogenase accessory factor